MGAAAPGLLGVSLGDPVETSPFHLPFKKGESSIFIRSWRRSLILHLQLRDRGIRANKFFGSQLSPEFSRDFFSQDIEILVDPLRDTRSGDNRGDYRMGQSKLRSGSL